MWRPNSHSHGPSPSALAVLARLWGALAGSQIHPTGRIVCQGVAGFVCHLEASPWWGSPGAGLAWACQDASRMVTPSKGPTTGPAFSLSGQPVANAAQFVICKDTPVGTSGNFHFEIQEQFPDMPTGVSLQ